MTKTILITGATSGIGEAVARAYAANSWTVVMVGTRATATGDAQAADLGSNAHYRQCDVSDETAVRRLAESVAADFGGIDVLVNSAGIYRG
ncbi:MAG TPA: SDR family NAD(P)-dependent oxidoreductase, partial [Acidimicrobiales bacterium]|nr:SDR family NAD(P)-dependent oxidoreductase [Acidimicrobiales bacterium]